MKMQRTKKAFVFAFFTLLALLFVELIGGRIFKNQIASIKKSNKSTYKFINIDWEKQFPYENEITLAEEPNGLPGTEKSAMADKVSILADKYSDVFHKFETIGNPLSTTMPMYDGISKLGYIINSRLSDPSMGDTYIRLKNGYWFKLKKSKVKDKEAEAIIAPYLSLQNYLKSKGIPFLYCYAPSKECAVDNEFPIGVTSYANDNINRYVAALEKYGVNYIDLRSNIHRDGLYHYALFYKTDHHWTVDTALWALEIIENELNEEYGLRIENIREIGPFRREVYEKAWLGSYGRAVTKHIAEPENFEMLYPEFETSFEMEIPDARVDTTGSFEDVFNIKQAIEKAQLPMYEQVLYGNRPYVKIKNLYNQDGPRILVIKDSFGIVAAPYLALSCSELLLLDVRQNNGNFTGSIVSCINSFKPDAVITIMNNPQKIRLN